jgi:HEAT repeat protein
MKTRRFFWPVLVVACGQIALLWWLVASSDAIRTRAVLKSKNPAVRATALRALSNGEDEDLLIERLRDDDPGVRLVAAAKIGRCNGYWRDPNGSRMASALILLLNDDRESVRREAAWSLSAIGQDAWPALREALQDDSARVRASAVLALSFFRMWKRDLFWPELEEMDAILDRIRSDPDAKVRTMAKEFDYWRK